MPVNRSVNEGLLEWIARGVPPAPIPHTFIERLNAIDDLSGTVSDVLDELGLVGVVPASTLRPTLASGRVIGRAITVRNEAQRASPYRATTERDWKMAEIAAIADAKPGDVLIIEGVAHASNMGGLISTIAKRQGLAGAVVDGAVRDVAHSRGIEFPIWSSHVSPITGKWRCITREVNGKVTLGGVTVAAGDLVIADETGVCFIPADRVANVVERCEQISEYETKFEKNIDDGLSVEDLINQVYGSQGGERG